LRLIKLENPQILFLMETKLSENEMEKVIIRCGYSCGLSVGCLGQGRERAGGLSLMWNDNLGISITSFSLNHIHRKVEDEVAWSVTGIYGFPDEVNKKKTWALIQELASIVSYSWLCFGDFNDVLSLPGKQGGDPRNFEQMRIDTECIKLCGLEDLGFTGYPFTWANGREGEEHIPCRLDRVLATHSFSNRFAPI